MSQPPIIPGNPEPYRLADVMPSSPPSGPKRAAWVAPVIGVLVLAVVALGAVAGWALLRNRPSSQVPAAATTPAPPPTTNRTTKPPETFTVNGILTLIDDSQHWKAPGDCTGTGGFSDIQGGADVVISGPAGDALALTHLIGGFAKADGSRVVCNFIFQVLEVPPGKGIYTLTIGHRPKKFTEDELQQQLALTLGG
jgi:hypothetical protein